MSQEQLEAIIARFHAMAGTWTQASTLDEMRRDFEQFYCGNPHADNASTEIIDIGVPCERTTASGARSDTALVLLHGGGFSMGSALAHRPYATHLATALKCTVFNVDYRLAPEHPFPAALEDAFAAYRWLLGNGFSAKKIAFCGDSAGGGLALSLMVKARDAKMDLPACAVLVSPWADLQCKGESYTENAAVDPIATRDGALQMGMMYVGGDAGDCSPMASPIEADLRGLPPVLLQVGSREIFFDDAVTLAERITQAGGAAQLRVWDGMIHQWPLHVGHLEEAGLAIAQMQAFVDKHWE